MGKSAKTKQIWGDEMDPVTVDQNEQVKEFIKVVVEPLREAGALPTWLNGLNEVDLHVQMYKFLTARKWNDDDAKKMLLETIEFKQKYATDEKGHFPPAFQIRGYDSAAVNEELGLPTRAHPDENDRVFKHITPFYQCTFHKWDKKGHPLMIERTGNTHVQGLVKKYKALAKVGIPYWQPCVDYHIHFNEVAGGLVKYNDLRRQRGEFARDEDLLLASPTSPKEDKKQTTTKDGKPIEYAEDLSKDRVFQVVVVFDMKGLSYGHLWKPVLELVKQCFHADSSYYPEGLNKLFCVNCPGMVMFAYNIVRPWIDPRVQTKIVFVKPDKTAETLLEAIDAENLPASLGGTCECEGGCIFTVDDQDADEEGHDDSMTEEIKIGAGQVEVREYVLDIGDEVAWEFQAKEGQDINFGVVFTANAGSEGPKRVVEEGRVVEGSDSFTATSPGALRLQWDNHFSWVRSKKVNMHVMKITNAEEQELAENEVGDGSASF